MHLAHTDDKEWVQLRKALWQTRLDEEYWEQPKKEIKVHEDFFFYGDLTSYIESVDLVRYGEVLRNFPARTLDQFKWVTHKYWKYAFQSDNSDYVTIYDTTLDDVFFNTLIDVLVQDGRYHPPSLVIDAFHWVFGQEFQGERTLDIGLSEWKPTATPDPFLMCRWMRRGVGNYLFEKGSESDCSYFGSFIDYFISVLPYIPEELFSLSFPEKPSQSSKTLRLKSQQKSLRELFLKFFGYNRMHNDKEAEEKIREALKTLPMPEAYYPFAEFIHEHKRKAITKSVKV